MKKKKDGKPPKRNDRGGETATMPIWRGYKLWQNKAGLNIKAVLDAVKEVAMAGPGMPAVQQMTPIDAFAAFEDITTSSILTSFQRAYAGGGWSTIAAGTRTIDMQRTAAVHFEKTTILGHERMVLTGVASRSKAQSKLKMRPLAWRAPIIPISQDDIDLQPMVEAMVGSDKGCSFRDFVVPEGAPHTIGNAIAWDNKAAPHATIVTSLIELLSPSLGAERASLIGGHCARHVLPEVGKALKLPREIRESLGYWREHPVIANEGDRAALARAITQARQRNTRAASIASSADRYASVDAATVVQDEARIACLLAIREAYQGWNGNVPTETRKQIEAIAAAADKA